MQHISTTGNANAYAWEGVHYTLERISNAVGRALSTTFAAGVHRARACGVGRKERDVVDDGTAQRRLVCHVVVPALEHHAGDVVDRRELKLGSLVPARAPGLVRHCCPRLRRVGVHPEGPLAAVARVPDGEAQPVPMPKHRGHLLQQRSLPAGYQLHSVVTMRHRVVRRVHVLDDLRVRHDHPSRQRRERVLRDGWHQRAAAPQRARERPNLEVPILQHVTCTS
jgi:hypothetical protein